MTKFRKKLLSAVSLSLVFTMAFTSTGCSPKKESSGKTQITVSNWPNKEANPIGYEAQMKRKADFESQNPNIEIVPDEWTFELQTFNAKAEGGTLPTIYLPFLTEASRILENGYSYDITDLLKEYGYFNEISDFFLDSISKDGKVYLIPGTIYSLGLGMNFDLLKEADLVNEDGSPQIPENFDELRVMAKTIKDKTGKAGFVLPSTSNVGGWIFSSIAWNFGVKFMEKDAEGKWKATFDSPETVKALQFFHDMKWKDNSLPANTLINADEVSKLLGTGQAGMSIINISQAATLPVSYDISKDSIVFAKHPAGPKDNVSLMGGGCYAIANNATPEQADAAMKWLKFIGLFPDGSEESFENQRSSYQESYDTGKVILGLHDLSAWSVDPYFEKTGHYLVDEFLNVDESHVASYNNAEGLTYHTEEPVCTQELYSILDKCIQETLTNENVDIEAMLETYANEFQTNYLDYAD